jgi:hypothetical protein
VQEKPACCPIGGDKNWSTRFVMLLIAILDTLAILGYLVYMLRCTSMSYVLARLVGDLISKLVGWRAI